MIDHETIIQQSVREILADPSQPPTHDSELSYCLLDYVALDYYSFEPKRNLVLKIFHKHSPDEITVTVAGALKGAIQSRSHWLYQRNLNPQHERDANGSTIIA